jgi:uncharacterized protein YjiS (DUF1127 family)/quercetin dioxygenase-like cupin family protein
MRIHTARPSSPTQGKQPAPRDPNPLATLWHRVRTLAQRIVVSRAARRALHELEELDDRLLADIGLTRSDVRSLVRRGCFASTTTEEDMKTLASAVLRYVSTFTTMLAPAPTRRAALDDQMTAPADLEWTGLAAVPGAQLAVIRGAMDEAEPYIARVKFPANTRILPHTHSAVEHATVLSGTLNMGMGDEFDASNTRALGPGCVAIMQPGTNHFAWFSQETVLQIHGIGPWTVAYVDPGANRSEH